MPATPVGICPIVLPASDAAIFMCDHLLGLENGIRRGTKKLFPEVANRFLSFKPFTIWRRIGVFKDTVLGHQCHHRLNVVPVEGVAKLVDYLDSRCCLCNFLHDLLLLTEGDPERQRSERCVRAYAHSTYRQARHPGNTPCHTRAVFRCGGTFPGESAQPATSPARVHH